MSDCIFKHDPPRQDCSQCVSSTTSKPVEETDCYCVCHSPVSSCAYCEHCKGINEVGAVHNPVLKALIDKQVLEGRIESELLNAVTDAIKRGDVELPDPRLYGSDRRVIKITVNNITEMPIWRDALQTNNKEEEV